MPVNANESVEWLGEERKYAWDYFQLHSSQRIASFNFYITLATAVVAAIGTILQQSTNLRGTRTQGTPVDLLLAQPLQLHRLL